ncbi:hypothetical protein P1P75_41570 [Streptomyces sp. ID05-39B]|uniref:hypothetical protein n=1 Tax=Streptomyces sp. ID05-39B TaxID=3028664 RepID=UPI0029B722FC|nr:hypothetical protein [Streptomyces sp. ID05-39B]MDX3532714.1 hypothetical protein [Streptomyces sp. ID05-39B]
MTRQPTRLEAAAAYAAFTEHPHFRYRGCAPDPDQPHLAAADHTVSVDAWQAPDLDGGEDRDVRAAREAAAVEVCVGCPVMVACDTYGASLTPEGQLAEPYAVLGGRTPLERHRLFVDYRRELQEQPQPAPVEQLHTTQKLAVLRALAAHTRPEDVAAAAGLDARKTNWQRSILVTALGLSRPATRMQVLAAAADLGLLDGVTVVPDDGTVPAVVKAPSRPRKTPPAPAPVHTAALPEPGPYEPTPVPALPRRRFTQVVGQLSLISLDDLEDVDDPAPDDPAPASVTELPAPVSARTPLGAAA